MFFYQSVKPYPLIHSHINDLLSVAGYTTMDRQQASKWVSDCITTQGLF